MPPSPDSTRARILDAAREEFSAEGFAGGRVDTIARLAGCNKQLIYHYFKDKAGLFEAVLLAMMSERSPVRVSSRGDMAQQLIRDFEDFGKKRGLVRMLMWEALSWEERPVIAEATRCEKLQAIVEELERAQAAGLVENAIPARLMMLIMASLMVFPWAFPQMTRMVTGMAPSDPEFRKVYGQAIGEILRRLVSDGHEAPKKAP